MTRRRRFAAITALVLLPAGLLGVAPPSVAIAEEHAPVKNNTAMGWVRIAGDLAQGIPCGTSHRATE